MGNSGKSLCEAEWFLPYIMYLCTLHYTHFQRLAGKHAQNLNNCLFYSNCFPDLLTQSGLHLSVYQQKILIESQREKVSIPMSDELNTIIGPSGWNYSHINNPWSVPWASVRMQFTSLKTCPALLCTVLGDTRCVPWSGLGTSPYSYQLVEESSQLCKAFHKAEVAASKAQEWSELRDCFGGGSIWPQPQSCMDLWRHPLSWLR